SISIWSLAAMGHALANSVFGFAFARGLLGLGESGNFPAAIKTVTEWFPKKERALATGVFNSGTNVGAIVAPLTVPWVAIHLGWLAKYFASAHGLTLTKIGPPLVVIYLAADIGSIFGGWLSSSLIKRGWSANRARKTAMLICALCVVPVVFIPNLTGLWPQVALFSLATAAHQGWSANIFTTASDMFPRRAVGSVVGIGGFGGAVGGMCIASFTGFHLQHTHSYSLLFVIAGFAYLSALLIIQLLVPTLVTS